MNLAATITVYGGGPGSGCNPEVGKCGRPSLGRWNGVEQTQVAYQDSSGHYLPSRVAIHDGLVKKYQNKPAQQNPVVHLIAGGTASGKTVASKTEHANLRQPAIVNMDLPRSELPEFQKVIGTDKTGLLQEEASDIRDKVLLSALAHNNDIALDAVGSPGLAQKLDALEKNGYKVNVTYVHRPVEESLKLAATRAQTATDPADRRVIPEGATRASHAKARSSLELLVKPGREVKIYDGAGKWDKSVPYDVIYHRTADGKVLVKNDKALERMRKSEKPEIGNIF